MCVFYSRAWWMLTDKYASLDFRGIAYLRINGRQRSTQEVLQDGLAHLP